MPPTITTDRSTNGAAPRADVAKAVPSPEAAGRGEGPPAPASDSRASFALFASFIAALLALAALLAVAFKLDSDQSTGTMMRGGTRAGSAGAPVQPAATGSTAHRVQVGMGDYFFQPQDATATAGNVKISAINDGNLPHELVLAKTNADPSQLPTTPDGSVSEEKLNSPGEISHVAAGQTKGGTIHLTPGKYVMFCNLPGHYAQGMYGTLTVK